MNVVFYSTGCPKCSVLKQKMDDRNIEYTVVDDVDEMVKKGFTSIPMLEVDGEVMDFGNAVKWVNGV